MFDGLARTLPVPRHPSPGAEEEFRKPVCAY